MSDLKQRIEQFRALELPGQPMSMHMGTLHLVNDLWKRIEALEAENANLRRWKALNKPITAAMSIANSHIAPKRVRIEELETALREARTLCDQNLGPTRSSIPDKIANLIDAVLAPEADK